MNTKPENISCRPGTTEAMERLAAENESLRAELESTANLAIKQGEWLQAIVNITKGKPEGLKHHTTYAVVESVEALRVERDRLAAQNDRLRVYLKANYRRGRCDHAMAEGKALLAETPIQSLAHIKAAGAREALQRATVKPGFSKLLVRIDTMLEVIADMESENVKS